MKRILIFLWMLFLPTQLGLHFWPEWSHVMGLRVDYLSPTLYFGDILWIGMILSQKSKSLKVESLSGIVTIKNILILSFVLINVLIAGNRWEAGYKWIRIIQWIITFKVIVQNKKLFKEMLVKVLPIWIIGESLLGLAQVVNGGSLNGIFYWLGERRFSYASLGVAQISYMGQGLIRAYGTFSHPNSLAGFLLISMVLWRSISPNPLFDKRGQSLLKVYKWIIIFCGLLGLFLSGSRTIWAIGIAIIIFNLKFLIFNQFLKFNLKNLIGTIFIGGGLMALVFGLIGNNYRIADFVGGWDSDGMAKRGALLIASMKMIKGHPLFGIGAGNFLVQLPMYQQNSGVFWLQPVHNIVILVITEFGLIGLLMMMKFSIYNLQFTIKNKSSLILLGIILATGMVDHYWLTLPQNSWLMCVVLGLM